MTKITFKNNSQPAINATNLNQLQTNIENAFSKKTLWSNSNKNIFNAQNVSLSSTDYNYLIIYSYRNVSQDERKIATIIEKNQVGEITYCDSYNNDLRSFNRQVTVTSGTVNFADATINGTTNNYLLVPYKIVGCKY